MTFRACCKYRVSEMLPTCGNASHVQIMLSALCKKLAKTSTATSEVTRIRVSRPKAELAEKQKKAAEAEHG